MRFFGEGRDPQNLDLYRRSIAPYLDQSSRAYWDKRGWGGLGRPRIAIFSSDPYRHGLLGRFIGAAHVVAHLHGVDLRDLLGARTLSEQRRFFDMSIAPLFDRPLIKWATSWRIMLYGLGIPPAQYRLLAEGRDMAVVLRERVERLCCGFPVNDNYFLWQAFARCYGPRLRAPLPPYLQRSNFDAIRHRVARVDVRQRDVTTHLGSLPPSSVDRYVLLDAQDWMTDAQLNALWREICRTARPGARVIFRTAATQSLLPGRLDPDCLSRWHYHAEASRAWSARDRSAIYGAFHLYEFEPTA